MSTTVDSTILAPTGSINANTAPPTIAAPAHLAGDVIFVACFWAQGLGNTTAFVPAGMTKLTNYGDGTTRQAAVFAVIATADNQFSAGFSLRSGVTSTRVAAVAWTERPAAGKEFLMANLVASAQEWNASAMSSDTFPTGLTSGKVFGVSFTNKSASATLTTHSGVGTGIAAVNQARAVSAASGSVSDSVTSVWAGGTGVAFNISQANGTTYSIGATETTIPAPPAAEYPVFTANIRDMTKYESDGSINANTSPPTLITPDYAVGDLLMVAVFYAQGVGTTAAYTPSGMTRLSELGDGTVRQGVIYGAVVHTATQFDAGIVLRSGAASTRVAAVAWTVEPVADEAFTLSNIDVSALFWNPSATMGDDFPPGVPGDVVFCAAFSNKGANATLTNHDVVPDGTLVGQARSLSSSGGGAVSDSTTSVWIGGTGVEFNVSQAHDLLYAIGVTIGVEVTGLDVRIGTGAAAYLSYVNELGDRLVPTSAKIFYPGFATIDEMEALPGATWAHRGGSANYPEMSEYAFDHAIYRSYGAIEFSAHRSIDGVWFGIHDSTLARTSESAGLTASVESMTWAAIQSHLNTLNGDGVGRPYYELDDFLEKYTDHLLIVDNKGGFNNTNEFLPKLLAVPNALDRIIVKVDGALTAARFSESKAAGFKVAGYWYDDYATKLPARAPYTDYIGMPFGSSVTYWNDIIATYGKMMWGHVCATQANYDMAIVKGADFVQCSNVEVIDPVSPVHN